MKLTFTKEILFERAKFIIKKIDENRAQEDRASAISTLTKKRWPWSKTSAPTEDQIESACVEKSMRYETQRKRLFTFLWAIKSCEEKAFTLKESDLTDFGFNHSARLLASLSSTHDQHRTRKFGLVWVPRRG